MITPPLPAEYAPYYGNYINKVTAGNLIQALQQNGDDLLNLINEIPEPGGNFRYAAGKWSIKEVLLHLLDGERIFAYRALCIARGDKTDLPGFDENAYAPNSNAAARTLASLKEEFLGIRQSTISLFGGMGETALVEEGRANHHTVTPRACGYIIVGHAVHHMAVIRERYLPLPG